MSLTRWRVRLGAALGVLGALAGCSDRSPPPAPAPPAPVPSAAAPSPPSPSAPVGPRKQGQHADFSFIPPTGFVPVSTASDPAVAAAYALPGHGPSTVRPTLSIVVTPTDGDLAATATAGRRLHPMEFTDYQLTLDEPITLPTGQRGWLLGGTYTLEGDKVRNAQLLVVEHNLSYVLTGVTSVAQFSEFEPVFRATFNTFILH